MRPQKLIAIGIRVAILTILISSLLFFTYYFTSYNFIIYLEYIFIFVIGAISFIIVLRILNHVKKHKRNKRPLLLTMGFIIFSCVIAVIYFRYLTTLLDTMRIMFVNESKYELKDVKITGCKKRFLDNIEPKASASIWIKITRDCGITVSYKENGIVKTEVVSDYVTTSMGQKLTFRIGDNK